MKDDDGFRALIDDLESSDKPVIRAAVDALISLAADSADLQNTLGRLLLDTRRKNRWPAAYVLAHLPQPSSQTIQILLDGLDHPEPDIRWAIGLLLVRLGKAEQRIVDSLLELCRKGSSAQKRMAVYSVRNLNLNDENSLEILLALLHDADPTVRVAVVTSLKDRSQMDSAARHKILRVFSDDPDVRVRNAAAITLAQLGSPSDEFLRALTEACEGGDVQLKKAALAAFALLKNKRSAPTGS
jgi:HEAT repeat protein